MAKSERSAEQHEDIEMGDRFAAQELRHRSTASSGSMKCSSSTAESGTKKSRLTSRLSVSGGTEEIQNGDDDHDDLPEVYYMHNRWSVIIKLSTLVLIMVALITCTLTIPFLKHRALFGLEFWKWRVMIVVLVFGRFASGWGVRLGILLVERKFLLRKRVLYFVYGLRNGVQNCIWLTLVLITWACTFDKKVDRMGHGHFVLGYVTRIFTCVLVGYVLWLLKTLLVKVLASLFHTKMFFDRVRDSLFNQYLIHALSGPPTKRRRPELNQEAVDTITEEEEHDPTSPPGLNDAILKKIGITIDLLLHLTRSNISAKHMKRLMDVVRTGLLSSSLDEQLEQGSAEDDGHVFANRILNNVAKQGSRRVYLADFMCFLREDEALKAIRLFNGECETNGISEEAFKNWVVNVFRDRRALALSLNDTNTAVNKVHQILSVVVGVFIVVICLLILKVANTHFFIFLSSHLLLAVFVFGNTCKNIFEAIIFLFVVHPFDVGDRCEIDGVQMIVEEMNVLTTDFLRLDNQKITCWNNVLAMKTIANYNRSPDMEDVIEFCINVSNPIEKIDLMTERITSYIENKSDHWYPEPLIVFSNVEELNRLKISLRPKHRLNFQDMDERWRRRGLLIKEMIKVFKDLDIKEYRMPSDDNSN